VPDDERIDRPKAPEAAGLSRHIAVFIEDSALWPLLLIFVVHVALGGALAMLAAVRGRSLPALAGLAILLALCIDMVRRARQRRRVARWIAMLWLLSGLTAAVSSYLGLL
jgi:alpha-beta hydrolase superfamily lysophospholipase